MGKSFENITSLDVKTAQENPQLAIHFVKSIRRWGKQFRVDDSDLAFSLEDKLGDSESNRLWVHFLDSTNSRPTTVDGWEQAINDRCEVTGMQSRQLQKLDTMVMRDSQQLGDYMASYLRVFESTGENDSHRVAFKLTSSLNSHWIPLFRGHQDWRTANSSSSLSLQLLNSSSSQMNKQSKRLLNVIVHKL